jgi:hypothetical protein
MRCSFCRRRDFEVDKLVSGPSLRLAGQVYICDRCAAEAVRIMDAHHGRPADAKQSALRRMLNRFARDRRRPAEFSSAAM